MTYEINGVEVYADVTFEPETGDPVLGFRPARPQ